LGAANLPDDLRFAHAGRVEAGGDQEQVLGRAFALPGPQAAFRLALRGRTAREQLEGGASQVLPRSSLAAREDQLHTITGGQIRELRQLHALGKLFELRGRAFLLQCEFSERLTAVLPPGDADQS
jgi:hypothetical protein